MSPPAEPTTSGLVQILGRLLIACLVACSAGPAMADSGPLSVYVAVLPMKTFAERIGGNLVQVRTMVAPGQSPHGWEPTPRQVAGLSGARLYWQVGLPFEAVWLPRILAARPGLRVLDARQGISLLPSVDEDASGEMDPHIWTSPILAKEMGARLRDALIELIPDGAAELRANYERFAAGLDRLDAEIRARLSGLAERRFLVFHPAWGYFARTYGLDQVSVERLGKEPGPRALAETIDMARAAGIRTVVVQPQQNPRAAEELARSIGARVESVDPLSADYFGTLSRLADLIAEASGH